MTISPAIFPPVIAVCHPGQQQHQRRSGRVADEDGVLYDAAIGDDVDIEMTEVTRPPLSAGDRRRQQTKGRWAILPQVGTDSLPP